jgi:hypothetical protein
MKGEEISDRGLVAIDRHGQKQTVEADTVVLACGAIPDKGLLEELERVVAEMHVAGDCFEARTLLEAVEEGARIAHLI